SITRPSRPATRCASTCSTVCAARTGSAAHDRPVRRPRARTRGDRPAGALHLHPSSLRRPLLSFFRRVGDACRRIRDEVVFWYRVVRDSIRHWLQCNAFSYAGSLAFYTLFSLAPVVIIAVTLIGLVFGEEAARGEIFAQLQDIMGPGAAQAIENAVLQSRPRQSGLMPTLLGL